MNPKPVSSAAGLTPGTLVPSVSLSSISDGTPIPLKRSTGPRLIVGVHSVECLPCKEYVHFLARKLEEFEVWGARVLVVTPAEVDDAAGYIDPDPPNLQVAADPDRHFTHDGAAVVITDEWGEIYFATDPGKEHDFPEPSEVIHWLRFIAIQCPECEQPEGEWKSL